MKFTNDLRQRVKDLLLVLERIKDEFYLPSAEYSAKCKKCSLLKICLPTMKKTAKAYCTLLKSEAQEVECL